MLLHRPYRLRDSVMVSLTNNNVDEQEEIKICNEFHFLLENSRSMFNSIRDVPQCGQKIWQGYFGKTFDMFTKLWKYQQQHRHILDKRYGLKRWQIGEIASKIGQLYYHYYLRTSDVNNLYEAYSFYQAIRSRQYYSRVSREDRAELMIKQLRYYARFIVVCMLMKNLKLVDELLEELDTQIVDYNSVYEPDNQIEWSSVMKEIKTFLYADNILHIVHSDQNIVTLSHRLSPTGIPPVEKSSIMTLTLQESILIGNVSDQVKYSEMTIDVYRMIQTLEREKKHNDNYYDDSRPHFDSSYSSTSTRGCNSGMTPHPPFGTSDRFNRGKKQDNPHKYIMYKPSVTQILSFLATGFKELANDGVLLLYISADGCFSSSKQTDDPSYDRGGVVTTHSTKEIEICNRGNLHVREVHCLYPGDLHPFTRKPLFVIVDSDNSYAFEHIPHYFGLPFVVLMSPQNIPEAFHGYHRNGNIFTLFLHSPLTAFCLICNIRSLQMHFWDRCQPYVNKFIAEASQLFTRSSVDENYLQFFGDDFLRLLILRYVFCHVVLRNHELFKSSKFQPKCYPPIPENEILSHPALQMIILDLASQLEVKHQFFNHHPSG